MDIQSLRTFQAVVEEGGILSASRQLNTVQSNVTARIKRLEEELGTALFYRQGRGLVLAPQGEVLLQYARRILQLEQQAGQAVRNVGESAGALRIGAMETFAALRLPPLLKQVRQAHPGVDLHISTDTSAALVEQVLQRKLDCAFVGGPVQHPDLVATELLQEELVLVRSRDNGSAALPLILFREGCAYRARALSWQREQGEQRGEVMELGTLDGILGCVAVGLGQTLMPRPVVSHSRFSDALVLQALAPHLATVPTVLIRHREALPMNAVDTLIASVDNSSVSG
ncbi:LysR substrate-binding domain-containing protein [Marinobacterium jannaschii]|uniref:LysR substrate-binding domain-containing protein n=1 Tax=Marinobacterium jannaschii TaxID=64970 RepID=UPI000481DE17|nr:LysR substrate-binding domain-containing protein [Marinobacterium jannaschii]